MLPCRFWRALWSQSHCAGTSILIPEPDPMNKTHFLLLVASSCSLLSGCGGGGNDASAPAPGPSIVDNVLVSTGLAANGVYATINQAGYLRVVGSGTGQPMTIGLGTIPMTGNAKSATGNGWLPSAGTFVQGTATLNLDPGDKTYSLKIQGPSGIASDSTLVLYSNLVKPTVSSLAGTYGQVPSSQIVVAGNSFSGTYGLYCTWNGNLTPQTNTIDVTDIQFQTATSPDSISAGTPCPYVGKTFTGTAYLTGPSAADPKGAFMINWDDGGPDMPTAVQMYSFSKQ